MNKYDAAWKYLHPIMRGIMCELAGRIIGEQAEVYEDTWDDCGFSFVIDPPDERDQIWVSLKLIDSCEYDTGERDMWGNILFEASRWGGEILIDFAPYNYTDRVWCGLDDLPELKERLSFVANGIDDIERTLNEAM